MRKSNSKVNASVERDSILLLGDAQVGKTSLIRRFLFEEWEEKYIPTVEDDYTKQFEINEWRYSIELLDTSGRYTFPAMRRLNISRSTAFILMFSLSSERSLEVLDTIWDDIVQEKSNRHFEKEFPTVVVGNKCDILGEREVTEQEAQLWADKKGLPREKLLFCSMKSETGVYDIFQSLWEQKVAEKTHLKVAQKSASKKQYFKKHAADISPSLLQMTVTNNSHSCSPSRRRFSAIVTGGLTEPKSPIRINMRKSPSPNFSNNLTCNHISNSKNSVSSDDRRNSRPSISKASQSSRGSKFGSRTTEVLKLDCAPS